MKLFDSELKLMELIWEQEPVSAKELHQLATKTIGWNKNTTYTILKKLIEKQAINRSDPNFICTSLIKKDDVRREETRSLIDRLYSGSKKAFFSAFFADEELTKEELAELKEMIERK
ncbi:MAG: BlaI/MecI/CopY family transcriptional regulator [Lachnospiraceae bacterium]|nr:BlaI/MecI/CopY family transcriptional regulator [Lachnospiraceae bacterium]